MADGHHILLLWLYIPRLCLPPVLLVSVSDVSPPNNVLTVFGNSPLTTATACATAACSKSPRSRTAKQTTSGSSFSPLSCFSYVSHPTPPLCTYLLERALISDSSRAYPRSSTSPSSPRRSPTCRSTFGPAGTPPRPFRSSACSPSPRRTSPLRSSRSPGC